MEKNMHYICVKDVEGTPLGEMVNIISFSWSMPQSSCHTCRWQEWKMTDRFRDTKVVPLILELNRLVESYHLDHHPIKKSPLRAGIPPRLYAVLRETKCILNKDVMVSKTLSKNK